MIIPGTTKLTFNRTLAGTDVNRTLVKNLGRNIIRKPLVNLKVMRSLVLTIMISFIPIMTAGNALLRGIMQYFKV